MEKIINELKTYIRILEAIENLESTERFDESQVMICKRLLPWIIRATPYELTVTARMLKSMTQKRYETIHKTANELKKNRY